MSQTEKQIVMIHILPNISKSKGNQAMKFGQFIEYNMRHIFLEKSYTKCGGETSPRSFLRLFLILYSINWPNFIDWLPLLLEILGKVYIAIICFLVCDIKNFKVNLNFLIKSFSYITKKAKAKI